MTKEYHVFTDIQNTHEQAFVFEVEREGDQIRMGELWLITSQNNGEVKTRVNLEEMFRRIGQNVGGNIDDENLDKIVEVFSDVLNNEKQTEIYFDMCQRELENMPISDCEKMIKASELCKNIEDQVGNLSDFTNNIINKRLK